MGHWCPTKSNYMVGWYFAAWKGKKEYYLPKKGRSFIKSSQKKAQSFANRSGNGHFCLCTIVKTRMFPSNIGKLEDLKVLRRSPDLLNNVKIVLSQLQLIMKQILFYHICGLQPFWSSDLNNPMNTPSNSPVISEEKIFK